ncbi:MAG: hypothetical protein ACLPUO_29470 [Streptosporangiaceae bacterium]
MDKVFGTHRIRCSGMPGEQGDALLGKDKAYVSPAASSAAGRSTSSPWWRSARR